jgi:hypothetical protein
VAWEPRLLTAKGGEKQDSIELGYGCDVTDRLIQYNCKLLNDKHPSFLIIEKPLS